MLESIFRRRFDISNSSLLPFMYHHIFLLWSKMYHNTQLVITPQLSCSSWRKLSWWDSVPEHPLDWAQLLHLHSAQARAHFERTNGWRRLSAGLLPLHMKFTGAISLTNAEKPKKSKALVNNTHNYFILFVGLEFLSPSTVTNLFCFESSVVWCV